MTMPHAKKPPHVPSECVVDFDIYHSLDSTTSFPETWKALQNSSKSDIVWTTCNGGHWIVLRGPLVEAVWSDYEKFSSRSTIVPKTEANKHTQIPTALDPPEHRKFRVLLNHGLSPRHVKTMEEHIRELAISLIEKLKDQGECDFMTAYSDILPIQVFMKLVDLPGEDASKLKHLADQITRPDGSMTFHEAEDQFHEYMGPIIDERMGGDGTDMISKMINGLIDGKPMTRRQALDFVTMVAIAGLDTVVNFLGFAMVFLANNHLHRRELVNNPELIPAAAEELLRRFPIVVVGREITRDMNFEGFEFKKGEMITTPSPLYGLDERENENPMEVDFHRVGGKHLSFGAGPHRCAGANLAQKEICITLEEWLKRIPEFEMAPNAEIHYRGGLVGSLDTVPLVWEVARNNG